MPSSTLTHPAPERQTFLVTFENGKQMTLEASSPEMALKLAATVRPSWGPTAKVEVIA